MSTRVQLIGGAFQDAEGNVLANGTLKMRLNQDALVNVNNQVAAGIEIIINLDSSGNIVSVPAQSIWGNDQMTPVNTFYQITGYKANGQIAWGPNNQQVTGSGGTFNVGTWVPNTVLSWTPPLQPLILQTNEVANGSQTTLDLHAGTNISLVDNGAGRVTIATTGGFSSSTTDFFISYESLLGPFASASDTKFSDAISFGGGCPAVMISLRTPVTVRKISTGITVTNASTFILAAVYSADGTTKFIDAGTNAFDASSLGTKTVTLGTPVTLQAGTYLVAWSQSGGSAGTPRGTGVDSTGLQYPSLQIYAANILRYARATNGQTAGAMPSSLGALSLPSSGQTFDLPEFFFE